MAGNLYYQTDNYKKAIKYYKNALSNITINELEADCKVGIANSYWHLDKYEKARSWYEDAISEVKGTPYEQNIKEAYAQ